MMDQEETISAIRESLEQLKEEEGVSRLMSERIDEMIETLDENIDPSLRADRVRTILEQVDQDPSMQNYLRTQVWNITAMLELL